MGVLGFMVKGLELVFRVLGFRGLVVGVEGFGCFLCLVFRVQGLEFRVLGFRGLGFGVSGFRF